jgi:hypothetical protein
MNGFKTKLNFGKYHKKCEVNTNLTKFREELCVFYIQTHIFRHLAVHLLEKICRLNRERRAVFNHFCSHNYVS